MIEDVLKIALGVMLGIAFADLLKAFASFMVDMTIEMMKAYLKSRKDQ